MFEGEHSHIIRIFFLPENLEKQGKTWNLTTLTKKNLENLEFEQLKKTTETWSFEQKYLNFY